MAKITASLSQRVDSRGKSEIYLRFVSGREHIYRLHSHLFVTPSRWKDGAIVIPRLETAEQQELKALRTRLDALETHLLDSFAEADREIVARYADYPGDRLLPFITTQKYNEAIKKMFLAAGLTRPVSVLDPVTQQEVKRPLNEVASSHLARRTFVGNLYKQVKGQNLVRAMSGHEDGSRAFARYRNIDDEIKAGVVGLLEVKK